MALTQVINTKQSGPYAVPPPLHICVLREKEKSQVITWDFCGNKAAPLTTKKNKIVIITDGHSVAKMTLFEELASKVTLGRHYIMKGYRLQGAYPPYYIHPTPHTAFYRTSPVPVTESLEQEAERLLEPPSAVTPLKSVDQVTGQPLLTFEGQVLEVFAIRRIKSGRNKIPMRQLRLHQDGTEVNISLWRESALFTMEAGGHVRLTHMKRASSVGGSYKSTDFTTIEVVTQAPEQVKITVIAVREGREKGDMELLLQDFDTLDVAEELWESLHHSFQDGHVTILAQTKGKRVSQMTIID